MITKAVQRDQWVDIYRDSSCGGSIRVVGTLLGFTSTSVTIRDRDGWINEYDANANKTTSHH